MPITLEVIEARKMALMAQFQKLSEDRNATVGALQDCEFWIKTLKEEEQNGHLPPAPEARD